MKLNTYLISMLSICITIGFTINPFVYNLTLGANGTSPLVEIEWLYPEPGSIAEIPINFTQGFDDGQDGGADDITAISFDIDYDQANLIFDPTDEDENGIPDSITFNMPSSFTSGVILTGNPNGEISISIVDFFPPLVLLPSTDGIVKIGFELMDEVVYPISICPVNASFSDRLANSIPGEVICGGIGCSNDLDCDDIVDEEDNCLDIPNGPDRGTCTSGSIGENCMSNDVCGTGGFCSMNQEDTYPPGGNGCGDACECEGDFDHDGDVDRTDVTTFLNDYGRNQYTNPCINENLCNGDFDCDQNVASNDVAKFLEDFGRNIYNKPCPQNCQVGDWCDCPFDTDNDIDDDGICGDVDNCRDHPNGTDLGTCVNFNNGTIGSTCTADEQCTNGYCSKNQEDYDGDDVGDVCDANVAEDTYPPGGNGCIDAWECEADFDGDTAVAANDVTTFLDDFGRSYYNEECVTENPCNGDFDCDGAVAANDVTKFLEDFGRSMYNKPCPSDCQTGPWCSY